MALDPVTNFAKVTGSTGYSAADVSVALSSAEGSRLPDPAADGAFNLVWYNATDFPDPSDDPNVEIVRCTARSGDTLTVTRAQEGTAASIKDLAGKTYKMLLAATEKTIGDVADRANHTGTQPASTISDFDAEVSNNADVAANTAARHSHGNSAVLAATTASFLVADESKIDAIEAGADVTDAGNVGSSIQGASGKTTPVDADTLPLIDSAASSVLKKVSWGNVKATLKAYFDALYRAVFGYKTSVTVGFANADYICDGTADQVQIQEAIDFVASEDGGIVFIKAGTYHVTSRITPKSNVRIVGAGKGATILLGGVSFDYTFYTDEAISNNAIEHLTVDVNYGANAAGIRYHRATGCLFNKIAIKNVASGGWNMVIGVGDGVADGVLNFNNKLIDVDFDGHAGSLEMLLLFNCVNTQVIRPSFRNKTGGGPIFGLFQKAYSTRIIDPDFRDNDGTCIYYSVTCDDIWIENLYAENCAGVIQGANESDNGLFGETQVKGLRILNPVIIGGENSEESVAIQLGAVNDAVVSNPRIEGYAQGLLIFEGNTSTDAPATNWSILNPQIKNCNPTDNFHILHPGIMFSGGGGNLYGKIIGGNIYDDQATKTQRFPIVFYGAFEWDYVQIISNRLSADSGSGGTSIALSDGATFGMNVKICANQEYTGTSPGQTPWSVAEGGTGATSVADAIASLGGVDITTDQDVDGIKTFTSDLIIGTGGLTPYFRLADSFKVRGNFGHAEFSTNFGGMQYRFKDSSDTTKAFIDADTGAATFSGGVTVPDEAYGAGWNGSLEVPTKNAIYDKVEAVVVGPSSSTDNAIARFDGTTGKLVQDSSVIIDDSGNVGIGAAPLNLLHINSASGGSIFRLSSGDGGPNDEVISFHTSFAGTANAGKTLAQIIAAPDTSTGSRILFRITDTAGTLTEAMRINAAGNVGIGTTAPKSKLHVEGASGWIIADEQDTDPTTAELDANDSIAFYNKSDKLVFAYNNAGTMTYLSLPLDGSSTTWTHSTAAP